jgi:hypothetical protein
MFRNGWNVSRGSRTILTTSSIRRSSRNHWLPLPRTWTRYQLFILVILCQSRRVSPFPFAYVLAHSLLCLCIAPALAETILREDLQPPPHQKREFVVDREGEMPTLAKPPLPNPNELRQSMTSTPVSVSSFLIHDAGGDDVPRSRSLDPIKVTRSKKKGTTGKKKRTSKPEVVVD